MFNNFYLVNKKIDYAVFYFLFFFIALIFVTNIGESIKNIHVYHLNINQFSPIIIICTLSVMFSLFRMPSIDIITLSLFYSAILAIIPIIYTENISNYWGNYFSLIISFVSYYICQNSKVNFAEAIYKICCMVCIVISIQVLATEFYYFPNFSLSNLTNVSIKVYMRLPIGNSNLIAAYLLPLIIFIISFKQNRLTTIVLLISICSMILCRSKNAILLALLIIFFIILKKSYSVVFKEKSLKKENLLLVLIILTISFSLFLIVILKIMTIVISELSFSYCSPYSNDILNYLDTISSGRIVLLQNELIRFLNHPFFGNGFGYYLGQAKSHNWIVEVLVQKGFIGCFIYMFSLIYIFKKGLRFYRSDNFIRASINLLCVIYLQGLFEITVFTIGIDFLIWSISGFLIARIKFLYSTDKVYRQKYMSTHSCKELLN